MNKSSAIGFVVAAVTLAIHPAAAADEAKKPLVKRKAEVQAQQKAPVKKVSPGIVAESGRRSAHASALSLFDLSFKAFQEGNCSLDRVITAHRMIIELETTGRQIAPESMAGICKDHQETASKISKLVRVRYESGNMAKLDLDLAETHRLTIAWRQKKAEADLAHLRAGGR